MRPRRIAGRLCRARLMRRAPDALAARLSTLTSRRPAPTPAAAVPPPTAAAHALPLGARPSALAPDGGLGLLSKDDAPVVGMGFALHGAHPGDALTPTAQGRRRSPLRRRTLAALGAAGPPARARQGRCARSTARCAATARCQHRARRRSGLPAQRHARALRCARARARRARRAPSRLRAGRTARRANDDATRPGCVWRRVASQSGSQPALSAGVDRHHDEDV